jgi:hypothetical protein
MCPARNGENFFFSSMGRDWMRVRVSVAVAVMKVVSFLISSFGEVEGFSEYFVQR